MLKFSFNMSWAFSKCLRSADFGGSQMKYHGEIIGTYADPSKQLE